MKERKQCYLIPDPLLSTSRDPTEDTDRFVKTISALFGAPLLRRGKDSLGEIFYVAKEDEFHTLIITHNIKKHGFSKLLFYKLADSYYEKVGTFNHQLIDFKEVRKPYDAVRLVLQTQNKTGTSLFNFLRDCFIAYTTREFTKETFNVEVKNVVSAIIDVTEDGSKKELTKLTFKEGKEELLSVRGYISEN